MDPKLYLLFFLFSTIVVAASYGTLRECAPKLPFGRSDKPNLPSEA